MLSKVQTGRRAPRGTRVHANTGKGRRWLWKSHVGVSLLGKAAGLLRGHQAIFTSFQDTHHSKAACPGQQSTGHMWLCN